MAALIGGINEEEKLRLESMIAYCYTNGIVMGVKANPVGDSTSSAATVVRHAPFSLFPVSYPRSAFEQAVSLAKPFNRLMAGVSRDLEWLTGVLEGTAKADPFTGRLLEIMTAQQKTGRRVQTLSLGVLRSDYMLHSVPGDERKLLQVEINTIASSFGCISTNLTRMMKTVDDTALYSRTDVPENFAMQSIANGIACAHKSWIMQQQAQSQIGRRKPAVLMVVQPGETNFVDQRLLHFSLKETHDIICERATLRDIHDRGRLDEETGQLLFGPNFIVSVVYFRAGYSPDDYPTEECWLARRLIEASMAIKCPNIALHLAGAKKIQQELSRPGAVERFLSPEDSKEIRSCFAGLYALDEEKEVDEVRTKVSANPPDYILKPQREGGGNNFSGAEMVQVLTHQTAEELKAFILMERIKPPIQSAVLVRNDSASRYNCLSELGIFGTVLISSENESEDLALNEYCGYLLRVKPSTSNEGGVAAGFAVLGCPCLV